MSNGDLRSQILWKMRIMISLFVLLNALKPKLQRKFQSLSCCAAAMSLWKVNLILTLLVLETCSKLFVLNKYPVTSYSHHVDSLEYNGESIFSKIDVLSETVQNLVTLISSRGLFAPNTTATLLSTGPEWNHLFWHRGRVFVIIDCLVHTCVDQCAKLGGIMPQIASKDEARKIAALIREQGSPYQVLDLEFKGDSLVQSQSALRYDWVETSLGKDIFFYSVGNIVEEAKNQADHLNDPLLRDNLSVLKDLQSSTMVLDVAESKIIALPHVKNNDGVEIKQLCAVPVTAAMHVFADVDSWKLVDQDVVSKLENINRLLRAFKSIIHSKGLLHSASSAPLSLQLPIYLTKTALVVSRLMESVGSLDDGLWVLSPGNSLDQVTEELNAAIKFAEDGFIRFGSKSCRLSDDPTLTCLSPDVTKTWEKTDFFAPPNGYKQLLLNNVIHHKADPSECLSIKDYVLLHLNEQCCLSLLSMATLEPEDHCLTASLVSGSQITTFQLDDHRIVFDEKAQETSVCMPDKSIGYNEVMTDCQVKIRDSESIDHTLISNALSGGSFLEAISSFPISMTDWPPSTWYAIVASTAGGGVLSLITTIMICLRCSPSPSWLRRYIPVSTMDAEENRGGGGQRRDIIIDNSKNKVINRVVPSAPDARDWELQPMARPPGYVPRVVA